MFDIGSLVYKVEIDDKQAQANLKSMDKKLKSFGNEATKVGKSLSKNLTLPILAVGGASLKLASDFEVASRKFAGAFKGAEKEASDSVENLSDNFGMASSQATALLAFTGDLLKGFGASSKEALDLATNTNEVAAALAAYNGVPVKQASEAVTKALLGERESLKLLGVAIKETDIKQQLMLEGKDKLTGQALMLAKAEATLTLTMKQSKDAINEFSNNMDTAAFQTSELIADAKDLGVELGTALLPIFKDVIVSLSGLVGWFSDLSSEGKSFIITLGGIVAATPLLITAIGSISTALALLTGPVGWVTLAITGITILTAAVVTLGKKAHKEKIEALGDEFGELAKKTGVAEEEMEKFLEISELVAGAISRNWGAGIEEVAYQVGELSKNTGLTREQVVGIGIESEYVSDKQKEILGVIQEQIVEEKMMKTMREEEAQDLLDIRQIKIDGIKRVAEEKKIAEAEEESSKAAELERIAIVVKRRLEAQAAYEKVEKDAQTRMETGLTTELEYIQEIITANEQYANSLIDIGYEAKETGQAGDDALKKSINLIQQLKTAAEITEDALQKAANEAADLERATAEADKEREATKKKEKEDAEDLIQTKKDLEDEWTDKLLQESGDREAILKKEKEDALRKAEELGADKYGILEYFTNKEKKLKEQMSDEEEKVAEEELSALSGQVSKAFDLLDTVMNASMDNWEETFGEAADVFLDVAMQSGNAYVIAAAIAVKAVSEIINVIKMVNDAEEERKELVLNIENEIAAIKMEARKEAIEQEYDDELANIEKIEKAKIEAFLNTLTEKERAALKSAGVIEETEQERIDREIAAEKVASNEAMKDMTAAEKAKEKLRLEEAVNVLKNEKEIERIRQEALDAQIAAEKEYKNKMAQYEYDKAVNEKNTRLLEIEANRIEALSSLTWWQKLDGWDDDVNSAYNNLKTTVSGLTIPAPIMLAGGGIANSPGSGINAIVGEAGPEAILPLNDRTLGALGQAIVESTAATTESNSNSNMILNLNIEGLGSATIPITQEAMNNGGLTIPAEALV